MKPENKENRTKRSQIKKKMLQKELKKEIKKKKK